MFRYTKEYAERTKRKLCDLTVCYCLRHDSPFYVTHFRHSRTCYIFVPGVGGVPVGLMLEAFLGCDDIADGYDIALAYVAYFAQTSSWRGLRLTNCSSNNPCSWTRRIAAVQ